MVGDSKAAQDDESSMEIVGQDESGKGGTGLGLCSCREIIESHQGRIRVASTVGKGTAFTIKLPAVAVREAGVVAPGMPVPTTTAASR